MKKSIVILYGPPGSGKGTQANLLAYHFGFVHFDTGKYIEQLVHDPAFQKSTVIKRERRLFDSGYLCTPSWVLKTVKAQARRFAKAGLNVVFSGSPRTLYEAQGLIPELEKLYGRKNIKFFSLEVPKDEAVKRNLVRERCSVCGAIIIDLGYRLRRCPICKGKLIRRTLDNKKALIKRFEEYNARTKPVFDFVRKRGYGIVKIDGRPLPEKVFNNISKYM
jgi:adenylate kinase